MASSVRSMFSGLCKLCGKPYKMGDPIKALDLEDGRTVWFHEDCVDAYDGKDRVTILDISEKAREWSARSADLLGRVTLEGDPNDGVGFNRYDEKFGMGLRDNFLQDKPLSDLQVFMAYRLLEKYEGQLKDWGLWPAPDMLLEAQFSILRLGGLERRRGSPEIDFVEGEGQSARNRHGSESFSSDLEKLGFARACWWDKRSMWTRMTENGATADLLGDFINEVGIVFRGPYDAERSIMLSNLGGYYRKGEFSGWVFSPEKALQVVGAIGIVALTPRAEEVLQDAFDKKERTCKH